MKIIKRFFVIAVITAIFVLPLKAEIGEGVSPVGSLSSIPVSISNDVINPACFELFDAYPNPFNPETIINYQLPIASYVELSVYNALGQKVKTLVNTVKSAGVHTISFNASDLTSGVYFYRIQAGNFTLVKKIVLMK